MDQDKGKDEAAAKIKLQNNHMTLHYKIIIRKKTNQAYEIHSSSIYS